MDLADLGPDQAEVLADRAVLDVGRHRVPADEDVGVVGVLDDPGQVGEQARDGAVDLDADLDAEALGVVADLVQGAADLAEGGVEVGPPGDAVGPDLHAGRADVVRQPDVLLGPLDVLADLGRVARLVLEGAAEPGEVDRRVVEPPLHLAPLLGGQVDLDLVRVPGPQLDPRVAEPFELLQDRRQVPVLRDVVRHGPELEHRSVPRVAGSGATPATVADPAAAIKRPASRPRGRTAFEPGLADGRGDRDGPVRRRRPTDEDYEGCRTRSNSSRTAARRPYLLSTYLSNCFRDWM